MNIQPVSRVDVRIPSVADAAADGAVGPRVRLARVLRLLAPFIGLGEVFDNPQVAAARYARPVVGAAIRAVAKPQVVGSVDFGMGREGLSVFMDINYSF